MNPARVVAELGPTNTGKTHRALTRLREFESGMIGLPLRLLACEVYERLCSALGEQEVALVTGEERRVPPRARYWVCTVEAMPVERPVDFLAVDEIQLAAHPERGHVFTDRLLHARGRRETWLLGSQTIEPLLRALVPGVEVRTSPRLSTLRSAASATLGTLPPRSAVVAFSARRVYELAERLRLRRGGVAIVLGALSPRARNAQVALFQSGEVDYLVATDAIGMGLNLDVGHVALAETRKFDGNAARVLEPSELAQIAGRAGRYQRDGTFGTLDPEPPLAPALVRAIEGHRLPQLQTLVWRSPSLDLSSPERLLASLRTQPKGPRLELVRQAEDTATLALLAHHPEVQRTATGEEHVRLLWELCQIPDYRQLLLERHARLVADLYLRLTSHGRLDSAWLEQRIAPLALHEGDIASLTARIAFVRTWTYVVHRDAWLDEPRAWQERTRALEDQLSDALHEALVAAFVDRRRRARPLSSARSERGAHLEVLAELKARLEAAAQSTSPALHARLVAAPDDALLLTGGGELSFEGQRLGTLVRGQRLSEPRLRFAALDQLEEAEPRARLERFLATQLGALQTPLGRVRAAARSSAARGIAFQLEQGLGTAAAPLARSLAAELEPEERAELLRLGVVFGQRSVYLRALLRRRPLELRRALVRAAFGAEPPGHGARPEQVSFRLGQPRARGGQAAPAALPPKELAELLEPLGFLPLGRRATRCDIVEKLLALPSAARTPSQVGSLLSCDQRDAAAAARALDAPECPAG